MGRFASQLSAAQRQYESLSPPDVSDDCSDAIDAVANQYIANFGVAELIDDLYDNGYAFSALDRLMCGRKAMHGDASSLQRLWRALKSINESVDRESQS